MTFVIMGIFCVVLVAGLALLCAQKGVRSFAARYPVFASVCAALILGLVCGVVIQNYQAMVSSMEAVLAVLLFAPFLGAFFVYPPLLTLLELWFLIRELRGRPYGKTGRFDLVTLGLGAVFSLVYVWFIKSAAFGADWTEVLRNQEMHTPVYTGAALTVVVFALLALAGYLVVTFTPLERLPPLLLVLSLAAMYLGVLETVFWCVQVVGGDPWDCYLLLLPLNCLMLTARTVIHKMGEWNRLPIGRRPGPQTGVLGAVNRLLEKSGRWPVAAFLLMWPLWGVLIAVLFLFGQEPNAAIKAWTETSDWNLSQRVAPQNIYYDEHYLCTVAAGGHDGVVKPIRMGVRHGHAVIVNRQLCVANAFEQVLEEKTPRLHRAVRGFYDRYGFPVARLIHSKWAADGIYLLMKPLEWLFLVVLYLTDADPESRIAVQYTGKTVRDFAE